MLIRVMSDLHLEMEVYNNGERVLQHKYPYFSPVELETDPQTVLILAGDIGLINSLYTVVPFLEDMCDRFRHVIYVMGNHEFYRSSIFNGVDKLRAAVSHINVSVLDNDTLKLDDVTFIGSTLWTDFDKKNPLSMLTAARAMNDYHIIRTGNEQNPYSRKLTPSDTAAAHDIAKLYIECELRSLRVGVEEKVVVITHHAPTFKSMNEMFIGSDVNGAYYSELGDVICHYSPTLWVHGHTHCSMDYMLCDTRIICNPRGYRPNDLNPDFDHAKVIEL